MFTSSTPTPWLPFYPEGVPAQIDTQRYSSLVELLEQAFAHHAQHTALSFMGSDFSYQDIQQQSAAFAAYLQSLGLQPGERVAVMMPNSPQYVVCIAAILRAGLVLVNVNPLYTARELTHQLQDSEASAMVIMENFAHTLESCLTQSPDLKVRHVITSALGDCFVWPKSTVVNAVVRYVKKLVPPWNIPHAVSMYDMIRRHQGRQPVRATTQREDLALLQYTGGTTGVAKGAMLLHGNLIANILQAQAWNAPATRHIPAGQQTCYVCALPLYHIFAFTVSMTALFTGGKIVLIPNPRDLEALFGELRRHTPHVFPGVNTLFNALLRHPKFERMNWSQLKVCPGGGSAVQAQVAKLWLERTGCPICEGYGLSETSPMVCAHPVTTREYRSGIGIPFPSTKIKIINDAEQEVPLGERGEIAISGPQVMAGYWQRPEDTRQVMTADGYFKSGDIGIQDEQGFIRIVDRKKDMILVSGFNVYPNEIEDVVASISGVVECAVIGVPDDKTGEAVKLFIVRSTPALDEPQVRQHCKSQLTGYKQPKHIVFCQDLPKSPIGKILRKNLRELS